MSGKGYRGANFRAGVVVVVVVVEYNAAVVDTVVDGVIILMSWVVMGIMTVVAGNVIVGKELSDVVGTIKGSSSSWTNLSLWSTLEIKFGCKKLITLVSLRVV